MTTNILVNFHSHSIFSDGDQTPEMIVANLAAAGLRYVALTDHDTVDGVFRFQEAAKKRGMACLPGLELTTWFNGREAHLLAYGFDPQHPDLQATLISLRQVRSLEVHSISDSLRKMGANLPNHVADGSLISAAPDGRLETGAAIDLLHRCGGKVFLAHPLTYEADLKRLERYVSELKAKGLDGLEAYYSPFSEAQRADLAEMAKRIGLLVCAGTDFHTGNGNTGIEMPRPEWLQFRQAVFASQTFTDSSTGAEQSIPDNPATRNPAGGYHRFRRRSYVLRIFLPTLIAIGLFLAALWGIILPSFEQTLLDRKRELIHELTNSAWSILASYEQQERDGLLTRAEAQAQAIAQVQTLRYGPESKDYFWLQDLQPRMVMHPYRTDLNGQDLSNYKDPRGVAIFVEFANLVRLNGEGYINYVWQWKDDPARLEPKESYVKGFQPWGWLIGTGIYIDDVRNEIARIERRMVNASLGISSAVVLLLLFVLQQSLRIERERQEVVDILHESTERYHSLVEATTEGTLLILDDRCRYANPTFLKMTGYTAQQIEFLDLADLLPHDGENGMVWEHLERLIKQTEHISPEIPTLEGFLRHVDGHSIECVLAINPIMFATQRGVILLARNVATQSALLGEGALARAAQYAPIGVFRARATRNALVLEMNPVARAYFSNDQPTLSDLFSDTAEFDSFLQELHDHGEMQKHILHLETNQAEARFISLSARLVHEEGSPTSFIVGTLQDVTTQQRQDAGREALIEKLQASLLFLHEPIARLGRDVLICDLHTSINELARRMNERKMTAALVASHNEVIGIVTDHDLRARVLAENIPVSAPIHTVMSAPLSRISEDALIYEALMQMEEKGVRHLVVEDHDGQIVSVIDNKSLIQFQRYGAIVITREISRSTTVEEVARHAKSAPPLVSTLLESSARPRHVTKMLASICDASTERLVQLAIDELGAPPVDFAFIAMGSQGRQEQTLVTDQDNGIIFAPVEDSDLPGVNEYFLRLGERVCDGLSHASYLLCRGGVMASAPRWCRSLPEWIAGFKEWIYKSEPQEIIDLSIFFDFRTVYGNSDLTHALRQAIYDTMAEEHAFLHHFARNALSFKPPFRLLGNIYLSGGATEHAGEINLKDAMMPIVSFARLYALTHQVNHTNTLDRIEALAERGLIVASSRDEIVTSYDFLMNLRLQNQVAALQAGRAPTNLIHPGRLGYMQKELLKQAFAQIAAVQKKISYDFPGSSINPG